MEDESFLRKAIRKGLEQSGYSVLESANASQALAVVESHKGSIDLVLTDVVMPGMSGRELGDKLRFLRPEARVVYMSGYTDDAIGEHGFLEPGMHFLQKPFTSEELLGKLRQALAASGVGTASAPPI